MQYNELDVRAVLFNFSVFASVWLITLQMQWHRDAKRSCSENGEWWKPILRNLSIGAKQTQMEEGGGQKINKLAEKERERGRNSKRSKLLLRQSKTRHEKEKCKINWWNQCARNVRVWVQSLCTNKMYPAQHTTHTIRSITNYHFTCDDAMQRCTMRHDAANAKRIRINLTTSA